MGYLSSLKDGITDNAKRIGGNILDGLGGTAKGFFLIPSMSAGKDKTADELRKAQQSAQRTILKEADKRLKSDVSNTSSATSLKTTDYKGPDFFTYEVQYNPASMVLRTMSGKQRQKKFGIEGETAFDDVTMSTFTDMTITLIFDAINNSDAFITATDSISMTGDMIGSVSNMVTKASNLFGDDKDGGDGGYTVRRNVQGFLALMTRTGWRNVTFFYGRSCFHGILTSVTPTYKMFNKSGEPIYAEVEITIRQDTDSELDRNIWMDSFLKEVNYKKN